MLAAHECGLEGLQRSCSIRLSSACHLDRKHVLNGVANVKDILKSSNCSEGSLPSTMSEDSLDASETLRDTAEPPSMGIWNVLRAWVGDCPPAPTQPTAHKSRPGNAHNQAQYRKDLAGSKVKTFEERVQAMAANRCQTAYSESDASSSENCCSARANHGHRPKRSSAMLQIMRSASVCSEDSSPSCSSEEELFTSWQPQYEAATRFLQTCLNTGVNGAALREAVADVYGAMHGVVALRQVALKEDRLEEVMSGVFFKPNQRLLLWMGGLRPTDLLACARIKMSALGETIPPDVLTEVEKLQTACRNRQIALTKSFEELSEKLSRASAVAQYVVAQRYNDQHAGHKHNLCGHEGMNNNPMIAGIRGAMVNMLIQADELRARLLEQLAVMLTPRQLALVLMAPLDMMASPF